MKQNYFSKTKTSCLALANTIETISEQLFTTLEDSSIPISTKELSDICKINSSIIQSINTIKEEIFEGKINNYRHYQESDLIMIDVILNIYSQFGKKNTIPYSTNYKKLKDDFQHQVNFLKLAIEFFPEDMAINVKRRPRIISNISLDYYQLIYLALSQTMQKIQSLLFTLNVLKLAKNKTAY